MHKRAWIAAERARGITYSYNDPVSWQTWNKWPLVGREEAERLMRQSGAE